MISRWVRTDIPEYAIVCAYADAKDPIFQMLFGWRECHNNESRFVFTRRDWNKIEAIIKYYKTFIEKNA